MLSVIMLSVVILNVGVPIKHISDVQSGTQGQYFETYSVRNLRIFRNKLECLSLAIRSSLVLCLWVRPGAYPRVQHLKGASLGSALTPNIKLGWKGLPD